MATWNIELVADLDDQRFVELVTKHLNPHTCDPDIWAAFGSPQLTNRTLGVLKGMLARCEAAAQKRKAGLGEAGLRSMTRDGGGRRALQAAQEEFDEWYRKNLSFRRMVERRLTEMNEAQQKNRQAAHEQRKAERTESKNHEAEHYRRVVRDLSIRIHQHQALTAQSGRDPEQHDHDLWRLLDDLGVPTGSDRDELVPLRRMLRVYWFETTPATVSDGRKAQTERLMKSAPGGRAPQFEGAPKVRNVGGKTPLA